MWFGAKFLRYGVARKHKSILSSMPAKVTSEDAGVWIWGFFLRPYVGRPSATVFLFFVFSVAVVTSGMLSMPWHE